MTMTMRRVEDATTEEPFLAAGDARVGAWGLRRAVRHHALRLDEEGRRRGRGSAWTELCLLLCDGEETRAAALREKLGGESVEDGMTENENGENGDLLIQKAPACTIQTQAEAVCELFGGKKEEIKVIGIRHGEKMYETLLTNEECAKAVDMGNFYRVPADNRGLNYDKYFKEGDEKRNTLTEFNSNNTRRLNLEETKEKIASLAYIQEELAKMQ